MEDDNDPYRQIAITIAKVDVPLSAERARASSPGVRPDTPERWIDNYAEGIARAGEVTREHAVKRIRAAFGLEYGMTPEAFADRQRQGGSGKARAIAKAAQQEAAHEREHPRDADKTR